MNDNLPSSSSTDCLLLNTEITEKCKKELKPFETCFPELGSTKFNLLLLKRILRILKLLFPKLLSVTLAFFLFLVFVSAAAQYNYYYAGLIPSKFYGSLTAHNLHDFKTSLYQSIIVLISACVCKSAITLVSGIMYVRWRALLTQHIHKLYFKGINFYKVIVLHSLVDNPDQRITQDVEKFCNQLANQLLPQLIMWPFVTAYYSYKTCITMGYIGILALYGYFIFATIINKFLMGPVISLVVEQESREGDLRFHHVYVRTNAESIAFYSGEALEREKAGTLLGVIEDSAESVSLDVSIKLLVSVIASSDRYVTKFSLFPVFVNFFDYFGSIITYIILGVIIFSSGYYSNQDPSQLAVTISQNAFFSLYLLNNFSTLIDQTSNLADLSGYAHRIGHLLEVLQLVDQCSKLQQHDNHQQHTLPPLSVDLMSITSDSDSDNDEDNVINHTQRYSITDTGVVIAAIFDHVTLSSLGFHNILIKDFTFKFERCKNVLVTGQTGAGKTSLLRVLKQLWPPLKGTAYISLMEVNTEVLFLPQRPLLTTGSLSEQIMYPRQPQKEKESTIGECLLENKVYEAIHLAGLSSLVERFGGIYTHYDGEWNSSLSPGEMQKVAFARIFYHKPSFVFLDEATSAMSENDEDYFYNLLKQSGITYLSIGHRSTIRQFHKVEVHFSGTGNWTVCEL